MKYCEMNPVRAKLVKRAERWEWSSAAAHCVGDDMGGLLCLEVWRHVFGRPETIGEDWREYLMGPAAESEVPVVRMPVRREGPHNRPTGWVGPADVGGERGGVAWLVGVVGAWVRPGPRVVTQLRSDLSRG